MILKFIKPYIFLEVERYSARSRSSFYLKRLYLGVTEIDWSLTGITLSSLIIAIIRKLISIVI